MSNFPIHTIESAPEASKPLLEKSLKEYGMIPGLHGALAEAPGLLKAYQMLHELFTESSFDKDELTVVWQTINVEHNCHYCVPAHTGIAHMMKVDPAITEALRNRTALPTEKLQVLHDTTLSMVRNRGQVSPQELEAFYAAGFTKRQVLEIILGLSQKVISNYTNHIAETPVDAAFQKFAWEPLRFKLSGPEQEARVGRSSNALTLPAAYSTTIRRVTGPSAYATRSRYTPAAKWLTGTCICEALTGWLYTTARACRVVLSCAGPPPHPGAGVTAHALD